MLMEKEITSSPGMLVFYVGYILDDRNTLCNGCILIGWSVLIQSLQLFGQCSFKNMW
jgi:hypothetical protein